MFVYLLICSDNTTYVGATVNLDRRLRQHNNEIKGGAKRTTGKVNSGKSWKRVCYISEFPDWTATLQFEWRWKQLSRKYPMSLFPLERRMLALNDLLNLTQSTTKAIPYKEWINNPIVHLEDDYIEACTLHLCVINSDDVKLYDVI